MNTKWMLIDSNYEQKKTKKKRERERTKRKKEKWSRTECRKWVEVYVQIKFLTFQELTLCQFDFMAIVQIFMCLSFIHLFTNVNLLITSGTMLGPGFRKMNNTQL